MIGWLLAVTWAYEGPHGAPDGCPACHEPAEEGVGPARPATPTCLGCHPTADMHPVGVKPVTTSIPAGWPLEDGAVTCATCHVEPAHEGVDPQLPRPWHREGPYATSLELCARCHDLGEYVRVDPHHGACGACHTAYPEAGASVAAAKLRTEPERLCATCHEGPVHHGVSTHLGAPAPADLPWPSWPDGQIACFTCHDVHDSGAAKHVRTPLASELRALAGLGPWPAAPAHPPMLVAPVDGLCSACHGVGP